MRLVATTSRAVSVSEYEVVLVVRLVVRLLLDRATSEISAYGPRSLKYIARINSYDDEDNHYVIVITFYSPSCLGQETAKGPFGLRVKLPPAHLSTTLGGGFTLSLLMLNVKQKSCEYQFL